MPQGAHLLYPASFREDYSEEMAAIFRVRLRDVRGLARLALWLEVFQEVIMNAPAAHCDILKQDLRYTARTLRRGDRPQRLAHSTDRL